MACGLAVGRGSAVRNGAVANCNINGHLFFEFSIENAEIMENCL